MLTLAETALPASLKWAPLIPTLPFIGMLVCGLAGASRSEVFRKLTGWITVAMIAAGFIVTCVMSRDVRPVEGPPAHHIVHYFNWINTGDFHADFSFFIDPL